MPGLDTASRVYPTCGAPPTVSKHVPPSHELDVLPGEPPENVYLQHQILGWKGAKLELEQTQLENKREELGQRIEEARKRQEAEPPRANEGTNWSTSPPAGPAQQLEAQRRQIEGAIEILKREVARRFLLGFRKEQLRTFHQDKKKIIRMKKIMLRKSFQVLTQVLLVEVGYSC